MGERLFRPRSRGWEAIMISEQEQARRAVSVVEAKKRKLLANVGATPTPKPAARGGRWALREEYLAGRLGATPDENKKLWVVVKLFVRHWQIARGSTAGPT